MINFFKKNEITRIKKNIQGNLVRVSSLFLIQLFYLPLMIYIWGVEKTGYWFYLLAIPSLLSFWKLNFSEVSKQELIIRKNANKNEIYTISFLFTFITLLIFAVIYFTINIKYVNFFEIFKNVEIYKFNWILGLIFVSFSIDLITNNLLTISQYQGKIYPAQILGGIFSILEKILVPLVGYFTEYLLYAAICLVILKITRYLISNYIIKKYITKISLNFKNFNKNTVIHIFKKSTNFYFNDLSLILNVSGFIYFVGYFFTAEIVAMIAALQTMFRFLLLWVFSIFENVVRFEYANFYKNKKILDIVKLYKFQRNILYILLFFFFLGVYFFGSMLFDLWTNNAFIYNTNLINLVALDSIIFILGYNQILLLYSLNKLEKISLYALMVNILSFIFLFYFETFRVNFETIYYVLIFKGFLIFFINMISNFKFIKYLVKN